MDLEKGQTVYVVDGLGFMPADQILHVEKREIRSVINQESFYVHANDGIYGIGSNAYFDRDMALDRALRAQGHRVVLAHDRRVAHLEAWERLLAEFPRELPGGWVRENFVESEFACVHKNVFGWTPSPVLRSCADGHREQDGMDAWFIERLQLSRKIAGIPYNITSGWRCEHWNLMVDGLRGSSHLKGLAADISAVTSGQRYIILGALIHAGFKRIGIREDFIHVDADPAKEQGIIWLY